MPKNLKRKRSHRRRQDGQTSSHRRRHRTPCLVHWFRKGLRLHDNPSLLEGLKGSKKFRCVYILDPWFAGSSDKGVNRWRFLLQCLEDLDSSLRKLNSRLFLIRGQPADVFPKLFKEWGVTKLSFDEDSEPFGRERDQAIQLLAKDAGVQVVSKLSHTLYDPLEIQRRNKNKPPMTYKRFQSLVSTMGPPPHAVDTITASDIEGMDTCIGLDHSEKYGIPTLEELGFDVDNIPPAVWLGGETEAKQRLDRHLERKAWVANFERPRMSPTSLLANPTGLGPYLRFGCLSPRVFYWRLAELYQKVKKSTTIPLSLHGHLLWREFFFAVACNNPNFDTMVGNPICVQIPWSKNQEALERWTEAKTGFPWIDAIMTQLRLEGWIHPLARHAVACFLTRGDLWINWEEGMKVFDEYLLEADWSINAGNWIWLSCSSFYQQFFHCYCPIKFGKRTDPSGDYVRKYLPLLKDYPKEYIFEPWTAPADIQEQAKCVIGKDYPFPMVNHAEASHVNLEKMKKVYQEISQYAGPGLLAAVPSSNIDSGPVPSDKGRVSTMAMGDGGRTTSTVSAIDYSPSSIPSQQMLPMLTDKQPMYTTAPVPSIPSSVIMSSGMFTSGAAPVPSNVIMSSAPIPSNVIMSTGASGMFNSASPVPSNVIMSSGASGMFNSASPVPSNVSMSSGHSGMFASASPVPSNVIMSPASIPSNVIMSTANLNYPSTATTFSSPPETTSFAPQNYQHMASTSSQLPMPITSTPPNYMVTATGDMVIPSRYALSAPSELMPPPQTVPMPMYTDSMLASNLDTINYAPLRMDRNNPNPMMGLMQSLKPQYQY